MMNTTAETFSTTFTDENYRFILYGMGHYPQLQARSDNRQFDELFSKVGQQGKHAVLSTLPLPAWIRQMHGMKSSI